MMGGFLISLGTISSAFSTSITEMYITIGLISGMWIKLKKNAVSELCVSYQEAFLSLKTDTDNVLLTDDS